MKKKVLGLAAIGALLALTGCTAPATTPVTTATTVESTSVTPTISLDLRQGQMTATSAAGDTLLVSATTTAKGWVAGTSGTAEPSQRILTDACESGWVLPLGFQVEDRPAGLGSGCSDTDSSSSMALISIPQDDLLGLRVSGEPFEVTVTAVNP